jgi:hypothetical protein
MGDRATRAARSGHDDLPFELGHGDADSGLGRELHIVYEATLSKLATGAGREERGLEIPPGLVEGSRRRRRPWGERELQLVCHGAHAEPVLPGETDVPVAASFPGRQKSRSSSVLAHRHGDGLRVPETGHEDLEIAPARAGPDSECAAIHGGEHESGSRRDAEK